MKTSILLIGLLINVPLLMVGQERLTRAESFFGFHFDFHATDNDFNLGEHFNESLLDSFLVRTKPDYIQIDSKGHPGYSSYPTQIGFSTNSFVNDPMRIWRDITSKQNIPLYVHYSGLWDEKAVTEHPEWARIHSDGSKDSVKVAYYSEYSSQLLIPQIKEMIDTYGIDGVWIDGDCWSTGPDYSTEIVNGFLDEVPSGEIPKDSSDKNYKKWLDYNRTVYREYLKNYVDRLHEYKSSFQVASNWAYSSMMPEKVDVNVDFLSGDVSGQNGMYSAAFQARCLALQGKPWDLMAWGFVPIDFMKGIHVPKTLNQLKQEAAEVISMGGGFQVYFQQNRDASFRTLDIDAMAQLSDFCRERQPFCQFSKVIPDIGVWYSLEGWKKAYDGVYGWSSNMEGIINMFLDDQRSIEILMDHHIKDKMESYELIVIPEWDAFNEEIKKNLIKYIANGGKVLVFGAKAVKEFEEIIKVDFNNNAYKELTLLNFGDKNLGGITGIKTNWQPVKSSTESLEVGHIYDQLDYRFATDFPVATINSFGKGKVAAIYLDMSTAYNTYRNPIYLNLLNQTLNELIEKPKIRVEGTKEIHLVLGKKDNSTLIHLINASGSHFNKSIYAYDELRPTPQLKVIYNVEQKPKTVFLQPLNKKLNFKFINNSIEIEIPPVEVHSIIQIIH